MENRSLLLTRYVFTYLYKGVLNTFYKKDPERRRLRGFQLYGFGSYDNGEPSLKQELENIAGFYVNGKYLYNKVRDAEKGASFIKLNKEYKFLLLNYLGYENLNDFLTESDIPGAEREKQLEIIREDRILEDAYFVSYYHGEDGKIIKGQVKVYNNWKNIEFRFVYKTDTAHSNIYTHHGHIIEINGLIHIPLKMQIHDKQNESGYMCFFAGKEFPERRRFLLGTYSGFDRDDQPVCGRVLLEKEESREEMINSFNKEEIDPVILSTIKNQRMMGLNFIPNKKIQLDRNGPFQSQLSSYSGDSTLLFLDKNESLIDFLPVRIEPKQLRILSLSDDLIENDRIYLTNKAQVLNIEFKVNGMFTYTSVSIQMNTEEAPDQSISGFFTAINKRNMSDGGQAIMLKKKITVVRSFTSTSSIFSVSLPWSMIAVSSIFSTMSFSLCN